MFRGFQVAPEDFCQKAGERNMLFPGFSGEVLPNTSFDRGGHEDLGVGQDVSGGSDSDHVYAIESTLPSRASPIETNAL